MVTSQYMAGLQRDIGPEYVREIWREVVKET
jgi:hypothetical protein